MTRGPSRQTTNLCLLLIVKGSAGGGQRGGCWFFRAQFLEPAGMKMGLSLPDRECPIVEYMTL
jgi:hypothetical protein